jgi:hypothetical protein
VVPSTWLSIVLFAIFVAPGLLFDLLSQRRRVGVMESTFREISRVVLTSLIFSGGAAVVLATVRTVRPEWMPDPRHLITGKDVHYLETHYRLILRTLLLQVVLSLAAASGCHAVLARRQGQAKIRPVLAWTRVLRTEKPKGHNAFVRVRLSSGAVYTGLVMYYGDSSDPKDRELVLVPPLASKAAGSPRLTGMPADYQRVVLRGDAIEVMSVQYWPESEGRVSATRQLSRAVPLESPQPVDGKATDRA